jgi:hypothetical protein
LLHGCFLLFNPADFGHPWTLAQEAGEFVQLVSGTRCIDLHPAIVLVADPTPETDKRSVILNEPAESDTLHATGNKPAAPLDLWPGQRFSSASLPASISARTAAPNDLMFRGFDIKRKPFSTT